MDKEKILNIVADIENKSNKDLLAAESFLFEEFETAKKLAIDLTRHMDTVEELHEKVIKEIAKRKV
jgi:hypothetical protein